MAGLTKGLLASLDDYNTKKYGSKHPGLTAVDESFGRNKADWGSFVKTVFERPVAKDFASEFLTAPITTSVSTVTSAKPLTIADIEDAKHKLDALSGKEAHTIIANDIAPTPNFTFVVDGLKSDPVDASQSDPDWGTW